MRRIKKILKGLFFVILFVFAGIQFIPIDYNLNEVVSENDISKSFDVPIDIQNLLKTSCYDCHSNNTQYPWYNKVQPVSWIMESHIKEGKEELNFNEFKTYSNRKKKSKLKSIISQIDDGEMPLLSYSFFHKDSKFSKAEKIFIMEWFNKKLDSL